MDLEEFEGRERERDLFLEEQIAKAYKKMSDIEDDSFILSLVGVLVQYLKEKKQEIERFEVTDDGPAGFFFMDFFSDVILFSKNMSERNAMVARFLSRIIIPGLSSFHHELNRREILEFFPEDFN